MDWLLRSAIGRLRNVVYYKVIQDQLNNQGVGVMLSPVSDLSILMTFFSIEEMECFLRDYADLFDKWFISINPWRDEKVERWHYVWLKLEDVPLSLWHDDFFSNVIRRWGKVRQVAKITSSKKLLEAAWIQVEVDNKARIPRVLSGIAGEIRFRILVSMVRQDSVPMEVPVSDEETCSGSSPATTPTLNVGTIDNEKALNVAVDNGRMATQNVFGGLENKENFSNSPLSNENIMDIPAHVWGGYVGKDNDQLALIALSRENTLVNIRASESASISKSGEGAIEGFQGPKEVAKSPNEDAKSSTHYDRVEAEVTGRAPNQSTEHGQWKIIPTRPKNKVAWRCQRKRSKKYRKVVTDLMGMQDKETDLNSEASLSDSDIATRNAIIRKEAEKTLETGDLLGISFEADRKDLIQALIELNEAEN